MSYNELVKELKLENNVFAITRVDDEHSESKLSFQCIYQIFPKVSAGETLYLTKHNLGCGGSHTGLGLRDGLPNTPGGFGYFLSCGRGEGFREGERFKSNPQVAEDMILSQPQNVLDGKSTIKVELFKDGIMSDIVIMLANPDQLSALVTLFNFRKSGYDNIIIPITSGCAQIFRIPFAELKSQSPRGVVGNTDIFSRPHLGKDILSFTVSMQDFQNMCDDTPECFFHAHTWDGIKNRM